MIKMREINNLTRTEIELKLRESREELANLEFQISTHQLDDTSRIRQVRQAIARIKTVLREFDLNIRKPLDHAEGESE